MNTTPIEKCYIGADAQYDVEVATANGWSNFSIYPNGRLIGTSPAGISDEHVPQYASYLKERAPELLAALKRLVADCYSEGLIVKPGEDAITQAKAAITRVTTGSEGATNGQ